jgi:hypothetical protein
MKTLKALKHFILGYKLHPKEKMRLYDLWLDIRTVILTILVVIFLLWLINISGCLSRPVNPEDFN